MNPFVEHLPWRIAALAGLCVGVVSVWAGVGFWASLLRVGLAFVVFGLGGLGLRAVLRQGQPPGTRIDQTTPPMSVEDVARQGDENET